MTELKLLLSFNFTFNEKEIYHDHIYTTQVTAWSSPADTLLSGISTPLAAMKKITITVEEQGASTTANKNPFGVTELSYILPHNMIGRYRIQLFSLDKSAGFPAAHAKLEKMRNTDARITYYPALLATEKGSQWIRAQIGPVLQKDPSFVVVSNVGFRSNRSRY